MTSHPAKAWLPIVCLCALALGGCQKEEVPASGSVHSYATYEDCVLDKVGRGQSKVASKALIAACRAKFPVSQLPPTPPEAAKPVAQVGDGQEENPYLALVPKSEPTKVPVSQAPSDEGWWQDSPLANSADTNTFHGYACTGNCSGHKAGYSWAERNAITDPDDCGGNSQSFIEGCRAYSEE